MIISSFKFCTLRKFKTSSTSSITESAKYLCYDLVESLQTIKKTHLRSSGWLPFWVYPTFLDVKKFGKGSTRFSLTLVFNSDITPLMNTYICLVFTNGIFSWLNFFLWLTQKFKNWFAWGTACMSAIAHIPLSNLR